MTAGWPHIHRSTGWIAVAAILLLACTGAAEAAKKRAKKSAPRMVSVANSQLEPADWAKLDGWAQDDHLAAFAAFMNSCKAVLRAPEAMRTARPILGGLYEACQRATAAAPKDAKEAREFFEQNFRPVKIAPLGENLGFITGYYEPIVDGSIEQTGEFIHPLYRTPAGLLKGGRMLKPAAYKRVKAAAKKVRRAARRVASFYDRAAIDDGVLAGRNLEIAYLKDPVDSFFIHIQGSARVRLPDGKMLRVNYSAQNGHAYFAVGKWLIDQKIYTKEEMSMDRIRTWMTANPEEGKTLRRMNKSYVFFRETGLADNEEPVGAQGVSLTPGRSIAVDRNLHVYGTPFFIQAELPIESEEPTTRFRRLMVAQDTGGAIIGPARADIYYGAGVEAGVISGRFKQHGQFVMLFPNGVDPFATLRQIPLPKPRPANIPQDDKPAETKSDQVAAREPEPKTPEVKPAAKVETPLPVSKPDAKKPEAKKPEAKKPEAKKPEPKKSAKPVEPMPPS